MKTLVIAALLCSTAGAVSAGEMESLSANAQQALTGASLQQDIFLRALPPPAVPNSVSEFKKLAAAFEKGTVPSKEELTGWNAGRLLDKDMPDCPGSLLMAGGETQPAEGNPGVFKIVPMTLYGSPDFYEKLSGDIAGGVAIFIKEQQKKFTAMVFGPVEATFEMIMPSYNKGFSRYAVRKAADKRMLVKHTWKDVLGPGSALEGVFYAYFTKNVTPQ